MKDLLQLAEKYNTDKRGHCYIEVYQEYLPKKCTSLLEIGIAEGASALMWDEYYGKDNLDLHYLDLFLNPDFVNERWCRNRGITPHKGSQADINVLSAIKDVFEVIIDDGSHNAAHQLISFKALFLNNLHEGCCYYVEDTHCNKDSFYWGEGVEIFQDTPLWMFKNFSETGKIQNKFFNEGESEVFENLIDWVKIEASEKLVIIKRK